MISETALLVASAEQLTREIFWNVPKSAKVMFYLVAFLSVAIFGFGCYRRWRLWNQGLASDLPRPKLSSIINNLVINVLLQRRIWGRGLTSVAHVLLFSGFVVLCIGTTLIAIEHMLAALLGRSADHPVFHFGIYYAVFEFAMDTFGIAFLMGVVYFAKRRRSLPSSVSHNRLDWVVLSSLFVIGVSGYVVEGLRILHETPYMAAVSPVGWGAAKVFSLCGMNPESASNLHLSLWWVHALLALGIIAAFPYTRLLHVVAGMFNLALQPTVLGSMQPIRLESVEETGEVGVGRLGRFSSRQLLMMDACVSCGRCEDACPAHEAGKPLSPKAIVQDLRAQLHSPDASLVPDVISTDSLWACTTCSACVDVCPLGVSPLGMITDMRRNVVGEGTFRGNAATMLQKSQRSGNPWGIPAVERFDWADGLQVPTVDDNPDFEVLYWVGCAASFDRRIQKVAKAVVRLLNAANVNFAVLGSKERCTGECARRMGDEFLFQELAETNLELLQKYDVKKIVTHCPHCLNSFKQDYPQFGGTAEIVHHSQFLDELMKQNRLPISGKTSRPKERITYHDPCYLARVNGVVDPPRSLLRSTTDHELNIIEMPRNARNTSCCGAGGGRMWFDDGPDERVGADRVHEAMRTDADCVAVACPFCLTMMSDGIAATDRQDVRVRDIAEILADSLGDA